jgi:hypothetical protein
LPELQTIANDLEDRGLVFMTVMFDGNRHAARAVAARSRLTGPIVLGDDGLRTDMRVGAYPWTLIIDRDGKPVYAIRGGRSGREFKKAFERFL